MPKTSPDISSAPSTETTFGLLACDVFSEEIEAFVSRRGPRWKTLQLLEMGLHDQPDRLRRDIEKRIGEMEADAEIRAIALAYGRCGNGLVGVSAGKVPLVLPQAHDCISILLGGKERHDALLRENPGTYFYSPGWVREKRVPGPDREAWLRELYGERFDDDEEMIEDLVEADREMFSHHNCAAYVSITDSPRAREYCHDCANFLGWRHHQPPCEEEFLHNLLSGNWQDDRRFVIVRPGEKIGADAEGSLIAKPSAAS